MLKSVEKYDPQVRAIIQLFILLLMGVIIGLILSYGSLAVLQRRIGSIDEYRATWNAFRTNFIIETIVISLNLTLLFGLFKTYLRDFKKTSADPRSFLSWRTKASKESSPAPIFSNGSLPSR